MTLWRQLTRGVRAIVDPRDADRDVADEVQHFLEQTTAALERDGLSPDAARRAARIQLGGVTAVREQVRDSGWESLAGGIAADLRFALRRLRSEPAFAALAVATLALGIGASTAIFSAVKPVLFAPLPYPHAERVVSITDAGAEQAHGDVTFGTYREIVTRSRSLESAAVAKPWLPTITGQGRPERLEGQAVSAPYFAVLGVAPVLGRAFADAEDDPGGARVAVISDGLWKRRFGGDAAIVGRQVTLDGDPYTVVGVMPARFENVMAPAAELWTPLRYDRSLPADGREWGHHLRMIARLRSGSSLDAASRELAAIAGGRTPGFARPPWASLDRGLTVATLQHEITRGVRPALLAVVGAVLLVLAIACVNVTNLILGRGARRHAELSMRAVLGAGRGRIVRQLVTESVLLALIGGAVALAVASIGVRALAALAPDALPRREAMTVDATVFGFALGVSALVGVIVGLAPALVATRRDLHSAVRRGSRRTAGERHTLRRGLVVAEVAIALTLLVGAGLLVRSVRTLLAVPPGFDPSRVLTMQVQLSGHRYDRDDARARFYEQALAAVKRVPGVEAAAFTSQLPLSGDFDVYGAQLEGAASTDSAATHAVFRYVVTPDYFGTLRVPLRRGRLLDSHDVAGAPPVVVVDEAYARRGFGGADPLGRRIRVGDGDPAYTIVGVVGDVRQTSLAAADGGAVYFTPTQWHWVDGAMSLAVRAHGEPAALAARVRDAIWTVDRDEPVVRVATMPELVDRSAAERRFVMTLLEAFAVVALLLAVTGVYGVLAASVDERTREIGVRAALGASRRDILRLVVGQAGTLLAVGVGVGLVCAAIATRALGTLLFGISPLDPLTYGAVVATLAAASAVACTAPAWRAAGVDPAVTLRAE